MGVGPPERTVLTLFAFSVSRCRIWWDGRRVEGGEGVAGDSRRPGDRSPVLSSRPWMGIRTSRTGCVPTVRDVDCEGPLVAARSGTGVAIGTTAHRESIGLLRASLACTSSRWDSGELDRPVCRIR